ncbi:MAG: TonB-dependent receptor, partial [Bacteroidaceae bacterium]|nr:TonB-dependent receptor [Bacteroidaceae bacterium]
LSLTADWQLTERLAWSGKVSYSLGRDDEDNPLPLISPVSWRTELEYSYRHLQTRVEVKGNADQTDYAARYGETKTPAWNIVNLSAAYQFSIKNFVFDFFSRLGQTSELDGSRCSKNFQLFIRAGVENLFDKNYSSYSDWNNIPQKGRNIYLNLTFEL